MPSKLLPDLASECRIHWCQPSPCVNGAPDGYVLLRERFREDDFFLERERLRLLDLARRISASGQY